MTHTQVIQKKKKKVQHTKITLTQLKFNVVRDKAINMGLISLHTSPLNGLMSA